MAMKSDVRDDSLTKDSNAKEYIDQWTDSLHAVQDATLQIIGPSYTTSGSTVSLGESDDINTATTTTHTENTMACATRASGGHVRTDKVYLFAHHLDKGMDVVALQNKAYGFIFSF
jgi:hypothetical protein